ncbi:CASP-like protein, putative [Theobroma cacao]|uniref:CASP-like protein n=1 Tax=Theobroma cacao TaxID=3641 RepID=A0A061ENQ6_THECC|nr:CASP-like protein, putative [Theobroma cacao]
MRVFPGSPGTLTSLFLRVAQCVFAAGSIASMATTSSFFNFTAFCYLIASMGLQAVWSFGLALLDGIALVKRKVLHSPVLVSLFVVGDWVTATLSLAAASASAGIAVLYFNDVGNCKFGEECQKYQLLNHLLYRVLVFFHLQERVNLRNFDLFIASIQKKKVNIVS